ncbi:uncharacterized protein LOC144708276 [Wolffia australiana]
MEMFVEDFEGALRAMEVDLLLDVDEVSLYQKLVAAYPGRSPEQLSAQLYALMAEYGSAITGVVPPEMKWDNYQTKYQSREMNAVQRRLCEMSRMMSAPPAVAEESVSFLIESLKQGLPSRRATRNVAWSDEEHKSLFLLGMDLHGKGDWKAISQFFVPSRTPTQIASHAQKFFKRIKKRQQGLQAKNRYQGWLALVDVMILSELT